jgi:branched-chain amino acid aminotransferase
MGRSSQTEGADASSPAAGPGALPAAIDGVLCDARTATVPLYDDGLLRGDGAFEYIRCYAGRPFALGEHLDRLERTCRTIRLDCPRALLERDIERLLTDAGAVHRDLRIVLTRGGRRILILEPWVEWPPARLAFIADSPRAILSGAKSLSYAGNMLARRLATERGFDEALLVTAEGHVMEVQQAAFFWVAPGGALCTPPLAEGILDSITRRVILKHLPVEERVCRTQDALGATEAFLAGTAREVQGVGRIEDRTFHGVPGPTTCTAVAAYRSEVAERLGLDPAELRPAD